MTTSRAWGARAVALLPTLVLAVACGLAESVVEGFVDDRDVEILAGEGMYGTLVRRPDGEAAVERDVLRPGDRSGGAPALGVVAFGIDPGREPDEARLERVRLRMWAAPGVGDVSSLGPLVVSHLPGACEETLAAESLPDPPGVDVASIEHVTVGAWHDVDVSRAFEEDWNAGRTCSVYVLRFATPTDGDAEDDHLELDAVVDGEARRIRVILHFGVDL